MKAVFKSRASAYFNRLLVDTNGMTRTNADLDPEFSSMITVTDPATKKSPPTVQRRKNWPDQGVWTVAYQDYFRHIYSADDDMKNAINAFALTAGKYGGYWLFYPQPGQTNDIGQTYPLRWINPSHPEDGVTASMVASDYAYLKLFLGNTNSRNFFFRGHGSPTSLGNISASEIKQAVNHRYRLVILQSCHSAEGNLDNAFGIKGPEFYDDVAHYQATGKRPGAFMGNIGTSTFAYKGITIINGVRYDGTIPWQVPYLYYDLLDAWDYDTLGWGLKDALDWAISISPPVAGWSSQQQPGKSLVIYGYRYLHIDEYNHASQWP
jgi:hypothetical protein